MRENPLSCEGGDKATTSYDSTSPSLACLSCFLAMINGSVSMIVVFRQIVEGIEFSITSDYSIEEYFKTLEQSKVKPPKGIQIRIGSR